ncbi:MAG: thioredoxin family protein [Candidatus Lokiarchaeota archaeon]|nr:thioredoxin family protein [Candidatus Lokiarchaeota archaeon]
MSEDNKYREIIKREMAKLNKPVRLKVFTSQRTEVDGSKIKACMDCGQFMSLLRIYEENSHGLLTIEELSIDNNPEFAKRYDIQRVPTILFVNNDGRELIRYLAAPRGGEIQPFVQSLFTFAGAPNYYEATIKQNLDRIEPSTIKVMITETCPYCPSVVSTVNQFALASEGKIRTVIIDISANPDIGQYYDAAGVPYTVINDSKTLVGMVGANEILRSLIGGNIRVQY